jgi:hypothetical protein
VNEKYGIRRDAREEAPRRERRECLDCIHYAKVGEPPVCRLHMMSLRETFNAGLTKMPGCGGPFKED